MNSLMVVQIVANSCLPVYNHLFSFTLCHFLSYVAVKKAVIQNESGFFKQKTNVLWLADWHLIIQSQRHYSAASIKHPALFMEEEMGCEQLALTNLYK